MSIESKFASCVEAGRVIAWTMARLLGMRVQILVVSIVSLSVTDARGPIYPGMHATVPRIRRRHRIHRGVGQPGFS